MKYKKHYLSFNSDFFLDSSYIINVLKTDQHISRYSIDYYQNLLKTQDTRCNRCNQIVRTIKILKQHLIQCNSDYAAHTVL